MRKFNRQAFKLPLLLITMTLLVVSCARSPYNFVKVQPKKPFEKVTAASAANPSAINQETVRSAPEAAFRTPTLNKPATPGSSVHAEAPESPKTTRELKREQQKAQKKNTRDVVNRELRKSEAFGALSARQLEKVEKIISKQADKLAKKKAASPAPVGFNQWMKIGVILLLIGLVVGIAFADLGYLVAVIGVVFLVLGLIQQL